MLQRQRYLELLSREYDNRYAVYTKLINLKAVLSMPKGTEHFISDIHGEYEAFKHILNNASGVIKEKVRLVFTEYTKQQTDDLCTLIYYPNECLANKENDGSSDINSFYTRTIIDLIRLANYLSSKYSRSKVRKAIDGDFSYIIDELMHAKSDDQNSRAAYHRSILDAIVKTGSAKYFILELCKLVKRLAVDKLHVLGDIFD